jgi:hypothetical protein
MKAYRRRRSTAPLIFIWSLYEGEWSTSSKKPDELMINSILESIQGMKHSFNPANSRRLETLYDSKLSL